MWEQDARSLAAALRDFVRRDEPTWRRCSPAVAIIDTVLSLRRKYERVVRPRVEAFERDHPGVQSTAQLRDFVNGFESPHEFARRALDLNSADAGNAILAVAEYLHDMQSRLVGPDEFERLRKWAADARPGDYLALGIHRFGLAGFQYLRMQFGANTVKPDVHIIAYVSEALGRPVAAAEAVYLLERAAELTGVSARTLDGHIWESRADARGNVARTTHHAPPSSR